MQERVIGDAFVFRDDLKCPVYNHSENLRTLRGLFAYLNGHFQPKRVICETGRVDGD